MKKLKSMYKSHKAQKKKEAERYFNLYYILKCLILTDDVRV